MLSECCEKRLHVRNYAQATFSVFLVLWTAAVLPGLTVFFYPQSWFRFGVYGLTEKLFSTQNFESDGSGMYFTLLTVLLLSIFFGWILSGTTPTLRTFCYRWCIFFLCLVLLKYGWMKVTHSQFYSPDPNVLDSTLGSLSKDTVYWSLVGSSPGYQLFMGICEVLTAILLLFRRTRFPGLIASIAVFANVFAINASFDISVKLLSLTCLLLSVLLLLNYLDLLGKTVQSDWRSFPLPAASAGMLWTAATVVLLTEALLPSFMAENPVLNSHSGTYEEVPGHQRFYLHRMGYVILRENGKLKSYAVQADKAAETTFIHGNHVDAIQWMNNVITCQQSGKSAVFKRVERKDELTKPGFHWISDGFH